MPDEELDELNKKSVNILDILDSGNFYQSEEEKDNDILYSEENNMADYLNIEIEPRVFLDNPQNKQDKAVEAFLMDELLAALQIHMQQLHD